MDPYQTLGLPKNCSREELKEAFRAKARLVHPDRGGEPAAFILLREAYDQISKELGPQRPDLIAETSARSARPERRPNLPDPTWEPDLILLDLEPIRTCPPASPDPNWEPDLIVLDDEPPHGRFPELRDPNWEPDLILLDDDPLRGRFPEPRDPRVARRNYIGWLRRVAAKSHHDDPLSDETWLHISGVMALFGVIILTIWICWAAWTFDPQTEAVAVPTRQQDLRP